MERTTIDELLYLGVDDIDILKKLVAMPFLQSFETTDALAVLSIDWLEYNGVFQVLADHPIFQDGIDDTETVLIAAVGTFAKSPGKIDRFLSSGGAAIETAVAGTKLTPALKVSIIRTARQPRPGTLELVRDAVEFNENLIGLPLPTDHVIVVLDEATLSKGSAGTNYGFAVSYLPKYEQQQDTREWRQLQMGLIHEVAHYYWSGNIGWIDEGLPNITEYLYGLDNGFSRGQLQPLPKGCEAHDLKMLSKNDPKPGSAVYECAYYLGQLLFQDLLGALGEPAFGLRLRELYPLTMTERQAGGTPSVEAVRRAFVDQGEIIERHWSGALNAPENRPFDEGRDRTSHDLIRWDQFPTYDGRSVVLEGVLLGDAVLANADLQAGAGRYPNFTLYGADTWERVGTIFYPLPSGYGSWPLNNPGDSVASKYLLHSTARTFTIEFPFPQALDSPQDYVVSVWGFQDSSQTPSIGKRIDNLGYARIRTE